METMRWKQALNWQGKFESMEPTLSWKPDLFPGHSRLSMNSFWISQWMSEVCTFSKQKIQYQFYRLADQVELLHLLLNLPVSNCITASHLTAQASRDVPVYRYACLDIYRCTTSHLEPIFVWWVHAACKPGIWLTDSANDTQVCSGVWALKGKDPVLPIFNYKDLPQRLAYDLCSENVCCWVSENRSWLLHLLCGLTNYR